MILSEYEWSISLISSKIEDLTFTFHPPPADYLVFLSAFLLRLTRKRFDLKQKWIHDFADAHPLSC